MAPRRSQTCRRTELRAKVLFPLSLSSLRLGCPKRTGTYLRGSTATPLSCVCLLPVCLCC